jgi:hypothetical protein
MTPWMDPSAKCIKFNLLMYGTEMGAIQMKSVEVDDRDIPFERILLEVHGDHGKMFIEKKTSYEAPNDNIKAVKYIFDAWFNGPESDIVIDDIVIEPGCSEADIVLKEEWSCNFDKGDKCDGTDGEDAEAYWQLNQGTTPSKSTGPLGDHTTGRGQYLFLEASQPRKRGDVAKFLLPPLTDETHCLTFWYHMYGVETGSMHVKARIPD